MTSFLIELYKNIQTYSNIRELEYPRFHFTRKPVGIYYHNENPGFSIGAAVYEIIYFEI